MADEKQKYQALAQHLKEKGYSEEQIKEIIQKVSDNERKRKRMIKWIITILILIGIIFGGYYLNQSGALRRLFSSNNILNEQTKEENLENKTVFYISNQYYYVPAEEMLKDKNREEPYGIKLRYYHKISFNDKDLSNYVKEHPLAYKYDHKKQKYKIYLIRVYNDFLKDVKVYYKKENEKDYKVVEAEFEIISYSTMQTTGNILIDNLSLDEGRYCFYVEAKDKGSNIVRSKEFCKSIVPFSFEEDKLDIKIIKPYVLLFRHFAFSPRYNFSQRVIEEIKQKNINFKFVDLSNPERVKVINSSRFIKLLNDTQQLIIEKKLFDLRSYFGIPLSKLEGFNYEAIKGYAIINNTEYDITSNVLVEER